MTINLLIMAVLALALVAFIFARQMVQRPVTRRSLLLPLVVCVVLGGAFLAGKPAFVAVAAVVVGVVLGIGTGLVSGQVMRLWRDAATGLVLQRGGWRYLLFVVALLLVRLLMRFVLIASGISVDEAALNAAFIAAIAGNFVGRDIVIALRALPLAGAASQTSPAVSPVALTSSCLIGCPIQEESSLKAALPRMNPAEKRITPRRAMRSDGARFQFP